ncbi:MAG: flagellar hook basal-body protein [Planctomycetes bacterium]|nr:flagellar hook basal-body protein [Planctomycetota bacterium]
MNESMNIAASGMAAIQRMLDTSAHNSLGSGIPGFQNHKLVLKSFGAFLDQAGPRQDLIGSEEVVTFEQGDLRPSDEPYSFALMGKGFMAVQGDDDKVYYTRNGDFTLNPEGELVTRAGYRVLAVGDEPIIIDPLAGPIVVDPDGILFQNGEEIAQLQIGEFPDDRRDRLQPHGDTLFQAPDGYRAPAALDTSVHQGVLEYVADGGIKGVVDMLVASKNYESMQRAIRSIDQLNETMIRGIQ